MKIAQSSHLQSYEYEPDSQTLTIQFQNGTIYQYDQVPVNVFYSMVQSGGAGTYFHAKIRDQYPMRKIFDPRAK